MKEPRADAKIKTLPEETQAGLYRLCSAEGGRAAMTLEEVRGVLASQHGLSVSLASLSEWRSWYGMRARMDAAKARAEQARLELLSSNPDMSPEKLEQAAQMVFTAEVLEQGDVKGYVALATLRLNERRTQLEERRIKVLEAKAAQADQAKAVLGQSLTPEEQNRRLREILT